MVHCSVPFCTSDTQKKKGISFHEYPVDENLRRQWIRAVGRKDESSSKEWQPGDRATVCSEHFLPSDYKTGRKNRRLIAGAVPSIFADSPAYKRVNVSKRCRIIPIVDPPAKRPRNISVGQPKADLVKVEDIVASDCETTEETRSVSVCGWTSRCTSVGTNLTMNKIKAKHQQCKSLQKKCERLSQQILNLRSELNKVKHENKDLHVRLSSYNIEAIEKDSDDGDPKAGFLKEQLFVYQMEKPHWSNLTLKYCILWHTKCPASYRFLKAVRLLSLPLKNTLKRYIGAISGENVTSLIKQRLAQTAAKLTPVQRCGSLVVDELEIEPSAQYMKAADKVVGTISANGIEMGMSHHVANRLLCFVFAGSSTHLRIPVAYFFTNRLEEDELRKLTLQVITELEAATFRIVQIVADNHSTNFKRLSLLLGGTPLPTIKHSLD